MLVRQKKSNLIYYIIGLIILAAIAFVLMHEEAMVVEHVEEVINIL